VFFNKPEKEKESKQKPTKLSAGKECYKKKTSVSPVKTRNIKKKEDRKKLSNHHG